MTPSNGKEKEHTNFIESGKDDIYENFLLVKKVKGEKEINKLLLAFLVNKNKNLLLKQIAIAYVSRNN